MNPHTPDHPPAGSRTAAPGPRQPALTSISGGPNRAERGQATAEYALVMLAAAAIAGLLLAWAASTDGISRLLNAVIDSIIRHAQ